ncbi:MAG: hypothetical protein ABI068_02060 [Ktedonobacterales bacterium]
MLTHEEFSQFLREFAKLSEDEQDQFILAMKHMVEDMRDGRGFRPGLRIKGVQGHPGVFEMTWRRMVAPRSPTAPSASPARRILSGGASARHDILKHP